MWQLIRYGHVRIAVFGPGGVGKTTLGHIVAGEQAEAVEGTNYQESLVTEKYRLQGDLHCTLFVPPGQGPRREESWPALRRQLINGRIAGVVNVVAAGYHAVGEIGLSGSYQTHRAYQKGMTIEEFLPAYLQVQRSEELKVLDEIRPHLCDADLRKLWMITLVTKQDLWWKEREDVGRHYLEGDYDRVIQQIAAARGARHFVHRYLPVSLISSNLRAGGTLLAEVASGYEDILRISRLRHFMDAIISLSKD